MSSYEAVIHGLEAMGEKVKTLPPEFLRANPELEPSRLSGLVEILVKQQDGEDKDDVLAVVVGKLAAAQAKLRKRLGEPCS